MTAVLSLRRAGLKLSQTSCPRLALLLQSPKTATMISSKGRRQAGGIAAAGSGRADDGGHELSTHVSSDGVTPRMVDVGGKVSRGALFLSHRLRILLWDYVRMFLFLNWLHFTYFVIAGESHTLMARVMNKTLQVAHHFQIRGVV